MEDLGMTTGCVALAAKKHAFETPRSQDSCRLPLNG